MISLRNSFYAFENYGQDTKLAWMIMYGVSGLLIPASLVKAVDNEAGINNPLTPYMIIHANFVS
jgi:cytochrome bd-type quinol oxidase subunit 2